MLNADESTHALTVVQCTSASTAEPTRAAAVVSSLRCRTLLCPLWCRPLSPLQLTIFAGVYYGANCGAFCCVNYGAIRCILSDTYCRADSVISTTLLRQSLSSFKRPILTTSAPTAAVHCCVLRSCFQPRADCCVHSGVDSCVCVGAHC